MRNKVNEERHLKIYGELREDIGTKKYLNGSMDCAKS